MPTVTEAAAMKAPLPAWTAWTTTVPAPTNRNRSPLEVKTPGPCWITVKLKLATSMLP